MTKKTVLCYGRFPEKFDGVPIVDIPSCNPNNEINWMGWTKKELEKLGWQVVCPVIPEVWSAPYSAWKNALDEANVDENTTLVGLSQEGAGAIVKYIIQNNRKIKKLILVAPARHKLEYPEFYDFEINDDVRRLIEKGTTIFVSNDDWPDIVEGAETYAKELDGKLVRFEDRGHFSFLIPTFPELLEEIAKDGE
ncbi:MAG: alpha/beta hydrolase [Parcubacteria group bacterium]|nr:alpha/beta hydrolase [Parcubacteria group bacterium]